jgi:centrosomal protein CEP104
MIYNPENYSEKMPTTKKFKKIGYLGLDSNDRSNFQARELKSVYIDYTCQKIKLNLHRCHTNIHNVFSQVGLIAINILGEYATKSGDYVNKNISPNDMKFADKLEDQMIYDPITLKRLKMLYKAKEKAVELEDFDEAKKIKEAVERLKSVSQQLIQLEERKQIAIKNDDFDSAKILKYEIDRLRDAVAGINLNHGIKPDEILPNHNKQNYRNKSNLNEEEAQYNNEYDK